MYKLKIIVMAKIKIQSEMLIHLAMEKYHMSKNKFTIISDDLNINGLVFYGESQTQKTQQFKKGKTISAYYWLHTDEKTYVNIQDLLDSKNIVITN